MIGGSDADASLGCCCLEVGETWRWAPPLQNQRPLPLLAVSGERLVIDQKADATPELDLLLVGQGWALEFQEGAIAFE